MELTIDGFLAKLFSLYPQEKRSGLAWIEAYKQVLNDENIDFEELYKCMISKYKGANAPSPAWLLEKATYKKNSGYDHKYIEFASLWAFYPKHNCWYEFGIDPNVGKYATKQSLIKKGFFQITDKNPRWSNNVVHA